MSDEQNLPITPLIVGVAGIIAASAFTFYLMNNQPSSETEEQSQQKKESPLEEHKEKELPEKSRINTKKTEITVTTKEEQLPTLDNIIKEHTNESVPLVQVKEDVKEEIKQVVEKEKTGNKKKKNKNKKGKNNEKTQQQKQNEQQQEEIKNEQIQQEILNEQQTQQGQKGVMR
jgi:hypothetical protein